MNTGPITRAMRSCIKLLVHAERLHAHGADWIKAEGRGGYGLTGATVDDMVARGLAVFADDEGKRVVVPTEAARSAA